MNRACPRERFPATAQLWRGRLARIQTKLGNDRQSRLSPQTLRRWALLPNSFSLLYPSTLQAARPSVNAALKKILPRTIAPRGAASSPGSLVACSSGAELLELASNRIHQRGDQLVAEVEPGAGRREQLGQRARAAQRQGLLVVGDGPRRGRSTSAARSARPRAGRCRIRCSKRDTGKYGAGDARNGRERLRNPTSRPRRRTGRADRARRPCALRAMWPGWL